MNIGSKRLITFASIVCSILLLLLVSQHMAFAATQVQVQPQATSPVYHYKTIPLFTNQTVQPNSVLHSQFIKVQNYHELTLFASCSYNNGSVCGSGGDVFISGAFSIDGVYDYISRDTNNSSSPPASLFPNMDMVMLHTLCSANIIAPYFRASIDNRLAAPATVTVTLYLIP